MRRVEFLYVIRGVFSQVRRRMIEGEADSVTITSPHIETDDVRLKQASIKLYPDFFENILN